MWNRALFLLALFGLTAASCNKDKDGKTDLHLVFKFKHDQAPLQMFKIYPVNGADSVEYQLIDFFVSDLALVKADGSLLPIEGTHHLEYNNVLELSQAEAGIKLDLGQIPAGDYQGLRFGLGLPPSINGTEPGAYPTTSPLGNLSFYWTAWNSYIFSRLEGRFWPTGASQPTFFLYHSGADGMFQSLSFERSIQAKAKDHLHLVVEAQARDFLFSDTHNRRVDIVAMPSSHSGAVGTPEYNLVNLIIQNMKAAMRLQD